MAKLVWAARAHLARKRRPLKVEVLGPERVVYRDGKEPPIVVKEEVIRWVDQIVLIPRWGINNPTHVNSLIRRSERSSGDPADHTSNVTPLKKVN